MRSLSDQSVDLVLTDPPYSSGTRREAQKSLRKKMIRSNTCEWFGSDSLTANGFCYLMRQCALEWHRILKPGGHVLSFIDWRMASHLADAVESADMRKNGLLVWNKTYFGMGNFFRNQHELILHFSKDKGTDPLRRDVSNVIDCKPVRNGTHPTEKPLALLKTLISVLCPEWGIVLDPFAGSCSTGLAAMAVNRFSICIEREQKYIDTVEGILRRTLSD